MRSNANLEMKVYNKIDMINRAGWVDVRDEENLLTDLDYLKAVEESGVIECEQQYFEFYERGRLVCSMYGYILFNDVNFLDNAISRKIVPSIKKLFPDFLRIKTLEIGSPVSLGLTVSTHPLITESRLRAVIDLLKDYSKKRRIAMILVRDFHERRSVLEQALLGAGFRDLPNFPLARMRIVWDSFDQYLSDLKLNNRNNARKRLKHKDKHAIRTVFSNNASALDYVNEYARLFKNTQERSKEYHREYIGEKYHAAMYKNMGDRNLWLQYFKDDELVAFCHVIVYNDVLIGHYMGLDYTISRQARLYFTAYYDLIKFAIRKGIKTFEAGTTSYETKSALGFSILPQRMYLWHQNALFRIVSAQALNAFMDYGVDDLHYAFNGNKHQYLWDGKSKYDNTAVEKAI